ncbi:SDR family NAD(P)-dependent oxidoreductase [Pinirhizobacter soli]|uniref:SDR family NAD(P)-dependent oxidoreductase n=1 Tax=Pinirhizobacter soli TaxID=2786953 RepID=UPI00202A5483|nr:SDR family oxidoreductase [Pinirhizobacter soli]
MDDANPRRALVTGASAGIGEAFARQLASCGYRLVLTARRADRLQVLAEELSQRHHVDVQVIALDLADPEAPAQLLAELARRNLCIDMLVNNAGYGVPGHFDAVPWSTHAQFLQVMVTAPTELAHRLLPAMRARGYGYIINVASLAGLMPGTAGQSLYAAAKAYLIKFSQSLSLENLPAGVHVTAVCPGLTHSEFHDVTGSRSLVSRLPRWLWMDADTVVRQSLAAVGHGDAVYVNGWVNHMIKIAFKILPDRMALRMVGRRSADFRIQGTATHP